MPTSSTPSDRFEARDLAILRHAAEYGVVLTAVLAKLFFKGKQAGHVVRKLADAGFLEMFSRALPGSITYARLSKRGCLRIGVSEKLSQLLSGHALNQAIAIVCYCVLGTYRRRRLTPMEMKELFGPDCPHANITHVLLSPEELSQYAVMRVVYCGHTLSETKKQLLRLIEESSGNKTLREAMAGVSSYGFLCLCPTQAQQKALAEALAKTEALCDALVRVEVGPGVEELAGYLKGLKEERS